MTRDTPSVDAACDSQLLEYRAIFENAAVGIVYTRDRVIYRCNERAAEILGYPREELEGLPGIATYPSAENYEAIGRRAGPLLAAGKAFQSDWQYRRKDGSLIWCLVYGRAVDPQQTDAGTVWVLEDVTEARRMAAAHSLAMAEMQAILDNASVAIVFTRDRKIIRCNPAFAERFGYPDDTAIGLPGRLLYRSDEEYAEVGRLAHPLLSTGQPFQHEMYLQHADGRPIWANAIGYLIDASDPTKGTIWLLEDRSAFKQAEEALRANLIELRETNRRLEETQNQLLQSEKLASIGQLAAGVAHEINNPVGFVSSNLHTLGEYVNTLFELVDAYEAALGLVSLPAGAQAKLDAVRRHADVGYLRADALDLLGESVDGVKRVRQIVQDLKDFSHVDAGEWKRVDLNACIASTLNVVSNEIKYKAKVERDLAVLPEVLCNAPQISQVIMNLLVNAAQAIETSGIIRLATGAEGDWAWFEVADDGKGMSEEVKKRIFEPFYTTKAVGQGTGLGLSVSYGIVGKHGGRIEVFSAPDQGARFRVWLPVNGSREEAGAVAG
ncbi:MAG: PAS domain S-box protein [Candidatus Accumulibacter sp.]|uniref:PAS domain S-box protein n=1 Tax=Accumulibacter sp. TaxID=2053492 RepID=UPI0025E69B75|nr:PAS domain S-box protein [Accumulibacter sp.]MCP5250022.1 PAS domain S-box protein [Accumulibacter sp.]